ncbi:MAG: hypothetical protein ACO2PL_05995 [Armatimonadota bacterium]
MGGGWGGAFAVRNGERETDGAAVWQVSFERERLRSKCPSTKPFHADRAIIVDLNCDPLIAVAIV